MLGKQPRTVPLAAQGGSSNRVSNVDVLPRADASVMVLPPPTGVSCKRGPLFLVPTKRRGYVLTCAFCR